MIHTLEVPFLFLLAGAIALSSRTLRRRMALPLGALALAIAGLRSAPGAPPDLTGEALSALPPGFRAVTAGLILIGIVGTIAIAVRAGRPGLWLVPGTAIAAWLARDIVAVAPIGPLLLAGASIALLVALGLGIGRVSRIRAWVMEADLRWLGSPAHVAHTGPGTIALVACTVGAALGPHLALVFAGAAAASWSLWVMDRSAGARWPVVPAVLTAVLGATYLFMATVAGPEGLAMAGLGALPISPAAETLLAAALLLASWLMSGLWPLQRMTPAPLLAPAGIVMLARVGPLVAPVGLEHWRPLVVPLAMLALWHAGARRWAPGLAVGAAWLAVVSIAPPPEGTVAAACLLSAGLALELLEDEDDGEARLRRWARRLAMMAAGWGGLVALEAALHGEVVYTVLTLMGVVLATGSTSQAMTPSAPRTPAPRA